MSTDGPEPDSLDVLEVGPAAGGRAGSGRLVLVLGLVLLLSVSGLAAWRWWPRPPGPLTFEELQGVYAGMVRSDGQNDAQQVRAAAATAPTVSPADCAPLVVVTQSGLVDGAADGMSTYWIENGASISLTTYRFVDAGSAQRYFAGYRGSVSACDGTTLILTGAEDRYRIQALEVPGRDGTEQLGLEMTSVPGKRGDDAQVFTLRLVEFNNTVSVLFRFDTGRRDPTTLREDRLSGSLIAQMEAVQDLRPR